MRAITLVVLLATSAQSASAFSVLAHQAMIDRNWDATLSPAIGRRHPGADLERARAFAYGGSHVADLGYFPLGSKAFTEIVHYVCSGGFVTNLLAVARDADEYAFALGFLGHYVADTTGHPEATNRVVADLYPELREKFGDAVTYADDHGAHMQTEFRFDVVQIANDRGGHDIFHHALQFRVATRALDEAFQRTYGLRLDDLFANVESAVLTYRWAFRGLIQEVTGIAWQIYRPEIAARDPQMTEDAFVYHVSRDDFEAEFGEVIAEPGYFARVIGFLAKVVPDVGPLRRTVLKPLPPAAQERYHMALEHAVERYRAEVAAATRRHPELPEWNLDTGKPVIHGEYPPADEAYAALIQKLAEKQAAVPPELRADIHRFFGNSSVLASDTKEDAPLHQALAQLGL